MNASPLISCQQLSKSFGSRKLFQRISLGVFRGDKIGMIGPNGTGKSTFLKILAGTEDPDEGEVAKARSVHIGYVAQENQFKDLPILDILLNSIEATSSVSEDEKTTKATIILDKLGFTDISVVPSELSGGWRKRLAIAAELMKSPDLLLLDEPTNHLDLEGVLWLEKFLQSAPFAYLVISHDRYFLEHITNRMIEFNPAFPKGLFSAEGTYSEFLEKKEDFLSGQQQQEKSLSSKVRREVEWLKQNPKARTTKSSSRIQEAHRLIGELDQLKERNKESKSSLDFSSSKRETQKLVVATNLEKSFNNRQLFSKLTFTLSPGTRLGIVGLNGSGKTTLLKILCGETQADKGTVKYADGLKIVYFDQQRVQIPPKTTLRNALAPTGDTVNYRGQTIHVNGWCKRFLFTPDRLDLPFSQLSGGEKARVHIARFMLEPADVLLLDEPTNDLDLPTLEILEESLNEFPGAIVLISHDRYMIDQISNLILGLGLGQEPSFFADFKQWEQYQSDFKADQAKAVEIKKSVQVVEKKEPEVKKMTYSQKKDLEKLEQAIMKLEDEIAKLELILSSADIPGDTTHLQSTCKDIEVKHQELDKLYSRWQELENKA